VCVCVCVCMCACLCLCVGSIAQHLVSVLNDQSFANPVSRSSVNSSRLKTLYPGAYVDQSLHHVGLAERSIITPESVDDPAADLLCASISTFSSHSLTGKHSKIVQTIDNSLALMLTLEVGGVASLCICLWAWHACLTVNSVLLRVCILYSRTCVCALRVIAALHHESLTS